MKDEKMDNKMDNKNGLRFIPQAQQQNCILRKQI